jgi:hypothetical protein
MLHACCASASSPFGLSKVLRCLKLHHPETLSMPACLSHQLNQSRGPMGAWLNARCAGHHSRTQRMCLSPCSLHKGYFGCLELRSKTSTIMSSTWRQGNNHVVLMGVNHLEPCKLCPHVRSRAVLDNSCILGASFVFGAIKIFRLLLRKASPCKATTD